MRKQLIVILFMVIGAAVWAQEVKLTASWSAAIPMGATNDYVKFTSGRGFQFELEQNINPRWSIGGTFAWQAFFNKSYTFYFKENSVISATKRNYINALVLMANTKYYFPSTVNKLRVYIGAELGTTAIENDEIYGIYRNKELYWHFAISPVLGVDIPMTNSIGINIYLKYLNSFKTKESIHYSWLNTGIGIYLKIP